MSSAEVSQGEFGFIGICLSGGRSPPRRTGLSSRGERRIYDLLDALPRRMTFLERTSHCPVDRIDPVRWDLRAIEHSTLYLAHLIRAKRHLVNLVGTQ